MSPAPVGTSPLHWAITVISVALITGLFAVAGTWLGRRADGKKSEERTRVSVDLHRAAFDGAVEELEQRLSMQIRDTVRSLTAKQECMAEKQDQIAADVKGVVRKLDRTDSRLGKLEDDTYTAIARADRVIKRRHPEDAA